MFSNYFGILVREGGEERGEKTLKELSKVLDLQKWTGFSPSFL